MARDKDQSKGEPALTEWQKRHLEFQRRRLEAQLEREAAEEAKRQEKRALFLGEEAEAQPLPKLPEPKPKSASQKASSASGLQQALPIILFAAIVFILSAYMVSPYSKKKLFAISGAANTADQLVIEASGIKASDYISDVFFNMAEHERAIVAKDPWVKSAKMTYQFPNKFLIALEEHGIFAYVPEVSGYRPVLESGDLVELVNSTQLPEQFLTIELTAEKDVKSLVTQLMTVDESVRRDITRISLAGSKATKDLLLLEMADGHLIRVPLSEVADKLPYYQTIRTKLLEPSIVDMEVGIYATTAALEALAAETKASKSKEQASSSRTSSSASGDQGSTASSAASDDSETADQTATEGDETLSLETPTGEEAEASAPEASDLDETVTNASGN